MSGSGAGAFLSGLAGGVGLGMQVQGAAKGKSSNLSDAANATVGGVATNVGLGLPFDKKASVDAQPAASTEAGPWSFIQSLMGGGN